MKLGLVSGEFPPQPGGVGDYTRELAGALAALGVEVHVITNRASGTMRNSNFVVHPIIRSWSFPALFQIRFLTRALNLDVLDLQYQAAAYGLSAPIHFLPHVVGVRTVVTFHDLRLPYLFPKAGRLRRAAVTHLARAAWGVIATDPADEADLRRRGISRVWQVPIGSNIAPAPPPDYDRTAWRTRLGLAPNDFLLGYFGFLSETKGADTLLSALAALVSRKVRAKLVLIGGSREVLSPANADFDARLEKLIARYDLTDRILRTDFVAPPEVSAHLLACDAVVLPYRDGVSFRRGSFMAALAHGCPVITTQPAHSLPELRDGVNVRLVPPDSASAVVLAVTGLLEAPELRAHLGQGARALAAHFTWDKIAARTLAFLETR
jgi:glycosyltransferase involved in cell wall biosynthesis